MNPTSTSPNAPARTPSPRVEELLRELTLDEKAALTAGSNMFSLRGVERLAIPALRTTDGPNGARGSSILGSGEARAVCIPCGSALGATWNPDLVEELGRVLGREARRKQARVLLAPTVNLHRSPVAGRNFECYSEDPLLSGKAAAAFVRGVQSEGVITTVKHFVGNDAETDRNTTNSVIGERALREIYLVPFEIAVKEGGSLGIMTAYNRLNGLYCTESAYLLQTALRDDWGFEGFVMTDWFSAADTVASSEAGLDIEMPAGDRWYGAKLAEAVRDGRVPEERLDTIVERILSAFDRMGALDDVPGAEENADLPEDRALTRRAATESIVLLHNGDAGAGRAPVLPLDAASLRSVAVIGPNAARAQIMGGGSAALRPHYRVSPLDALRARFGDARVAYEPGCSIDRSAPLLAGSEISAGGETGFVVDVYASTDLSGEPAGTTTRDTSRLMFMDDLAPGVTALAFSARARTTYVPSATGAHTFELTQTIPSRVLVDGALLLDGVTNPPAPGSSFFGMGSAPFTATLDLEAGTEHEVVVEVLGSRPMPIAGVELGVRAPLAPDALDRAVAAARGADVAVVVVGTNDDWESEGWDRSSIDLPGDQDALVEAVLAVNPRTVVVVNAASPMALPWADRAGAVLQCWFGGQEMANAIADVLLGDADPGGRLPTTIPTRIEHNPSFGNFPGVNNEILYGEGVYVGYRWYDSRYLPVRFPFGHGLSYTTFEVGAPELDRATFRPGDTLTVRVPVTNTGSRHGSHVVQCYVAPPPSRLDRPAKELRAFAKVELAPGESTVVSMTLGDRAFAYWDPADPGWPAQLARVGGALMHVRADRRTEPGWTIEPGTYGVLIANSAADVVHRADVTVEAGRGTGGEGRA